MIRTVFKLALPFTIAGLITAFATTAYGQGSDWEEYASRKRAEADASKPKPANSKPKPDTTLPATRMQLKQAVVYTRVPRTRGRYEVEFKDGTPFTIESPDVWDKLPDSSNVFDGFNAPGQLVLLEPDGTERILYDCFEQDVPCVPLDPAVSFDGRQVLFSVYRGKRLGNLRINGADLPNQLLRDATEAQLHVVDLESGIVTPLTHSTGVFDVSPAWLPDGRIMFASTRAGNAQPQLNNISPNDRDSEPQLFISALNGADAVNITPHEVATAMHPYVLHSGRVVYSSQWLSHNLAYIHAGGINWPGTTSNFWVVHDIDLRGGDMNAVLGGHRNSFKASHGRTKNMKALHFLGERHNGDICTSNYYRANNLGLGDVFCWAPEPIGVEGALPDFLPRSLYNVADWSKSNDEPSFTDSNGVYLGKIGYPEGIPNNQLMLTVGRGLCTHVGFAVKRFEELAAGQPNKLACDVGIYATTQIPSKAISDLSLIVDREDWHEFGSRLVAPRQVATPPVSDTEDGSCQLASSDAGTAETHPTRAYEFNHNYTTTANNGGEIDGLKHSELAGMRFWEVVPNPSNSRTFKNSIGNQLRLLGDVPLLEDNSFKVQLPCDVPYIMAGIDKSGRVIKRDQVTQSLRPGEKRVCTGCHLHSKQGRPYESSVAYRLPPIELMTSRAVPTYETDVKPIFEARCQSCHEKDFVPLMNYDQLVWDYFQESLPEKKRIKVSNSSNARYRYGLQRPYTSKYVNTMFARESLLYWKAANERTDGRKDNTYKDDIDFGADHPTNLTEAELETIAAWLDSGATEAP